MALSIPTAPTNSVSGATSIVTAFPTGYTVTANDLGVAVVFSKNRTETTIPGTPTGWTQSGTGLGGVTASGVDAGKIRVTVFTRVLQAGDTAPTVGQAGTATGNLLSAVIYPFRRDSAGTYDITMTVLSEATSSLTWSESMTFAPDWQVDDHLIMASGATTDSVTGMGSRTLTATGLTIGTVTEDQDYSTTQGDDGHFTTARCVVTAGPPTTNPAHGMTLTGVASTGAMALIRVRHVVSSSGATVTPSVVGAVTTIGSPVVVVPAATAAFTVGQSLTGGVDVHGFGATTQVWTTQLPLTVAATTSIGTPLLWGPPSGLQAVALAHDHVRLTWNAVLAAEGYMVERDGVIIADNITGTQYDDMGVVEQTLYSYNVQGFR